MDFIQLTSFAGIIALLTLIIGILVKVIGLPDQIKKNRKNQSTQGLSTAFMLLSFVAYSLWTIHGIMKNDMVLVLGQGLGIITTGIIIYQIYLYRDNK